MQGLQPYQGIVHFQSCRKGAASGHKTADNSVKKICKNLVAKTRVDTADILEEPSMDIPSCYRVGKDKLDAQTGVETSWLLDIGSSTAGA